MDNLGEKLPHIAYAGIAINEFGDIRDASGQPSGREGLRKYVRFTDDDDKLVEDWVIRAQAEGRSGQSKVFDDLESINPRHTAASWKARWRGLNNRSQEAAPNAPSPQPPGLQSAEEPRYILRTRTAGVRPGISAANTSPNEVLDSTRLSPPIEGLADVVSPAVATSLPNLTAASPTGMAPIWSLPHTPKYAAVQSRKTPGQIRALDWNKVEGRERFEGQQLQLAARWGLSTHHQGTCILVPLIWSTLDPMTIIDSFDFNGYTGLDHRRLVFSFVDHATTWGRAAAWFGSAPHNGVELDNFLGSGPYRPMEGSHLCHQPFCVNPHHIVFEDAHTNHERKSCHQTAQDLRGLGVPIPRHCARLQHADQRCLLQHAALDPFEAFLIQFSILRQARGLPPRSYPTPLGHPYPTFEYMLPTSFGSSAIVLDPAHLCASLEGPMAQPRPVFYCSYCPAVNAFKSLSGYWAHIRDRHALVSEARRLEDIVRAGRTWEASRESSEMDEHDTTWRQVQQMKQEDFNWEVVSSWRLGYSRKRKYGKDGPDDPSE